MAQIKALTDEEVSPEVQEIFEEIQRAFGKVPNLFRTAAHFPPLLKANWEKFKAVMVGGHLSRKLKEIIALLVSQDNGCHYCVRAHSQALKALGVTEAELDAIYDGHLEKIGLSPSEIHLITLARTANRAPSDVPDSLFERLWESGTTSAEIVEVLGVVETFIGFNKFLDSLKVEIDF
ncbi:MAG: carboxymuconolactone decarboxylase family protein [Xenococcaceae cyanobacterium]